ncbi:hypothetical protein CDV25_04975 [Helicobacter apodemus]|uniref:Uncharacterized protein n=1 Tax=Helicobacter apodemus TaxID=135569 RepID=A0A2U8FD98_9HELI|nr:hypothetical protein CDV25_04975 [Helicobacter apodemus]
MYRVSTFYSYFAIFMSSSFALLYYAMKSIDLSVGYAVWSGGGSATYLYCWLYAIQRRDIF